MSAQHALLLNADYEPFKVISWRRAIELLLDERVDLVENYVDRFVRSVNEAIPWPAVLRLKEFVKPRARMRFSRQNVLARDGYQCAYCGRRPVRKDGRPDLEELTLDHVVPRAQSKGGQVRCHPSVGDRKIPVTCWENVVSCCAECNLSKADRTPEQAGMRLKFTPHAPNMNDILRMNLRKVIVPNEWKAYLPTGAERWSGYWEDELSAD